MLAVQVKWSRPDRFLVAQDVFEELALQGWCWRGDWGWCRRRNRPLCSRTTHSRQKDHEEAKRTSVTPHGTPPYQYPFQLGVRTGGPAAPATRQNRSRRVTCVDIEPTC